MPLRYVINLILIVAVWFVLNSLIQSGVITNYWSGILITVGINIILATSLNVATGYLGQLPLGHAGFMAVGAYAGGIFMKAMPVQELLKAGNTGAAIPYILLALLISAIVAGIFGIIIGIPALRLRGDYLAIITLGFGEIIRVILTNIDSVIGTDFTYGAAGLKLSFPDYNDPSSTLVKMYLHGEIGTLEEVNPYGASLFFTVDRYASYCRHWRPDYEAGKILVADRYSTSNIPHQMSRLPKEEWDSFLDWLCDVEYNKAGLPRPTAVVYMDVDPEVSRRLLSERYHGDESKRDIHEADFAYLQHCRSAALYGAEKQGWHILSCTEQGEMLPREVIAEKIRLALGLE